MLYYLLLLIVLLGWKYHSFFLMKWCLMLCFHIGRLLIIFFCFHFLIFIWICWSGGGKKKLFVVFEVEKTALTTQNCPAVIPTISACCYSCFDHYCQMFFVTKSSALYTQYLHVLWFYSILLFWLSCLLNCLQCLFTDPFCLFEKKK